MNLTFLIGSIICLLATANSIVLILKPEQMWMKNRLLGFSLLCFNLYLLFFFLLIKLEFLLQVPHLIRTLSPLMYLTAPFFYLFVRNSIFGYKNLDKRDWIHFLPALIHFTELIPFYLQSYEYKMAIATSWVEDSSQIQRLGDGLIPNEFHVIARILQQVVYFIFTLLLVFRLRSEIYFSNKRSYFRNWLFVSLFIMGWFLTCNFTYLIIEFSSHFEELKMNYAVREGLQLFFLIGLFFLNSYIYFYPQNTFDLQMVSIGNKAKASFPISVNNGKTGTLSKHQVKLDPTESAKAVEKIQELVEKDHIFTEVGLTTYKFSKAMGVSKEVLSEVIKNNYGMGFSDFINHQRIDHAKELLRNNYLEKYTIEKLSADLGYKSKVSFYNNFKRISGTTPASYISSLQKKYEKIGGIS